MTYLDVKAHYINEEMEIALATQKQIDRLCKEVGSDHPQMVYDLYQEELEALMAEVSAMIKIILPAPTVDDAIGIRDRIRGLILEGTDRIALVDGGVMIITEDPLRVCQDLEADGFVDK